MNPFKALADFRENLNLVKLIKLLFGISLFLSLLFIDKPFSIFVNFTLIGFVYSTFLLGKKILVMEHFLLSFFFSSSIVINILSFLDLSKIPINHWTTKFIYIVLTTISIVLLIKLNERNFNWGKKLQNLSLVFVFLVVASSLYAKVVSVLYLHVPIAHDPITHAEYSRSIVDSGSVEYFYSSGLHLLAAFGELIGGFLVQKQILILTNVFNALYGVPVYLFIKYLVKKDSFANISLILFSLGQYPAAFYYTAGKNSFVVASSFVFLFIFLWESSELRGLKKWFLCSMILLTMFFVHYLVLFILFLYFIVYLFKNLKRWKVFFPYIPIGIICAFYLLSKYKYQVQYASSSLSSQSITINVQLSLEYILAVCKSISAQIGYYMDFAYLGKYFFITGILGWVVLLLTNKGEKVLRYIFVWFILIMISLLSVDLLGIQSINIRIIYFTLIQFAFVLLYIFSSFVLSEVILNYIAQFSSKTITTFGIALICLGFMFIYTRKIRLDYINNSNHINLVTDADVATFEWINRALPKGVGFVNNSVSNSRIGDPEVVVFPTDGGAWIPVYTGNNISADFSKFSNFDTFNNNQLLSSLRENPANCVVLKSFKDKGYEYYYRGDKPVFGPTFDVPEDLVVAGLYEKLMQIDNAIVYRIIGCE